MVRAGKSMAPTLLGLNGWPRRRRLLIASTVDAGRSWESSSRWRQEVRFWHKADMLNALTNVRFWGQSGHGPPAANQSRFMSTRP